MDRWSGILKVSLHPNSKAYYRVAASLCLSSSRNLTIPYANAIFFNGDRVESSGEAVIDRLSDIERIAEVLVSKFGSSINAYAIEASTFNGPFAVYKDFIPSVNSWGEPKSYNSTGFPASTSTVSLLSHSLQEAKKVISRRLRDPVELEVPASCSCQPKTFILGFSKGGTVLNQLVTELGFSPVNPSEYSANVNEQLTKEGFSNTEKMNKIIPNSKECLLNSVSEIHYVDVGLNTPRAYLTDNQAIERISKRVMQGADGIRFILHGTPRQWCDCRRAWIRDEKNKLVQLLELEAQKTRGRLRVCERLYFADKLPSLRMHFEIIESLDVS